MVRPIDTPPSSQLSSVANPHTPLIMYKLLVWSLLAFVPLTGVRMVCLDRAATATSRPYQGADCDQFCLRSNAPGQDVRSETLECMLIAECSLLAGVSSAAILPSQMSVTFDLPERKQALEVPEYYMAPLLANHTPPPRA